MEPHSPYQYDYVLPRQGFMQKPPLPGWARAFRTTLLVLAGILVALLLVLFSMATSTVGDIYQDSTVAFLQSIVWVGLALPALGLPYLVASVVYAALWMGTLRGRGYRSYPATTWMLVAGPLAVGLAIIALAALIIIPARML